MQILLMQLIVIGIYFKMVSEDSELNYLRGLVFRLVRTIEKLSEKTKENISQSTENKSKAKDKNYWEDLMS